MQIGTLDVQSSFAVSETIPPGLAGLTARFRGYSIGYAGRVVASFDETLLFE